MAVVLPFAKMQAIGNDFVVLDEAFWPASDWSATALRLCDRQFGIGGDGLLVVGESDRADVRMRMFNPDGTEDMCGNGLRCVVHYAHAHGLVAASGTIESFDGIHKYDVGDTAIITEMAPPLFHLPEIPVDATMLPPGDASEPSNLNIAISVTDGTVLVDAVNTGSTHAVLFRKTLPIDDEFLSLSPQIENSPIFSERTSVLWAVVESSNSIRLRIWERGVGETLGCGTGACAAAVLANVRGLVDDEPIRVISGGGELSVYWNGQAEAPVELSGTAYFVYTGMIDSDG